MSKELDAIKEDVAFLRALAGDSGAPLAREGFVLIAIGATFAPIDIFYWLRAARVINVAGFAQHIPWIVGVLALCVCVYLINSRLPERPRVAARAIGAASAGVGYGLIAAVIGLFAGSIRLHQPSLVTAVFPVVVFTLYGAVWMVAYAVRRRLWYAGVAAGCLGGAIALGATMGRPEEWLILAAGMAFLVAAPGAGLAGLGTKGG